jgi:hypothetical protein
MISVSQDMNIFHIIPIMHLPNSSQTLHQCVDLPRLHGTEVFALVSYQLTARYTTTPCLIIIGTESLVNADSDGSVELTHDDIFNISRWWKDDLRGKPNCSEKDLPLGRFYSPQIPTDRIPNTEVRSRQLTA